MNRLLWCGIACCVAVATFGVAWNAGHADNQQQPAREAHAPAPDSWTGDLTAIGAVDWNYSRAAHLLERAGFGGTPEEIEKLAAMSPQDAVGWLVNYERHDASKLRPFVESGIWPAAAVADVDEAMEFNAGLAKANRTGQVYGVRPNKGGVRRLQPVVDVLYYRLYVSNFEWERAVVWWANRMLLSPRPLEEKLTLFWHGHFATEHAKVLDYRLMLMQNEMLRKNASGNFRDLLVGIAQDPAMLVYLDNRKNVKGQANENFAREVMELFALGVGNYTENDIKEAARALTGWGNLGPNFLNREELHDDGPKTVLGKTGNFTGHDVIDIILEQQAAANFITRKLYRFFVREDLSPEVHAQLAATLRDNKYDFKPLLTQIFLSKDFYSPSTVGTQLKSPTQFLVSTYRKLGLREIPGTPLFSQATERLGQRLGNPPNVKGWDGGRAWINPSTLMERANIVGHALFPETAAGKYPQRVMPDRYINAVQECEDRDREAAGMLASAKTGSTALSASMINSAPNYDLKLGVYNGYNEAFRTVKPIPPTPAPFRLAIMTLDAGVKTPDEAVEYLVRRFLRVPLSPADRATLVAFARQKAGGDQINYESKETEHHLREVLHLIVSTPEYQLY